MLREIPSGDDGDFSDKNLIQRYNSDLANGLGNLIQRVVTLVDTNLDGELIYKKELTGELLKEVEDDTQFEKYVSEFRLHDALAEVWKKIATTNAHVNDKKPWAEVKENPEQFLKTITTLVGAIHHIAWLLAPFLPETSGKIFDLLGSGNETDIRENSKLLIRKGEGLFPRP